MSHDDADMTPAAFIAPSASITGKVSLGRDASIWHNVTLRGDLAPVGIGDRSNVQDGAFSCGHEFALHRLWRRDDRSWSHRDGCKVEIDASSHGGHHP